MGFAMPATSSVRPTHGSAGARSAGGSLAPWEQTWAMWAHLGALLATLPSVFLLQFLVPLVILLSQRDRSTFVADHAREALNFHISMAIWTLIGAVLSMVCIGFVVIAAVWVLTIVCGILAAIAASRGEYYRYPVTFRFV